MHNLLIWKLKFGVTLLWENERDPYIVWLSEVILQQTRVTQGEAYFTRFLEAFPTIYDLANASEQDVLALWQGLGYYSRARNLHHSANYIVQELDGIFPNTFEDLKALRGVGDYTAAAIASFAFGLPHAVVDGNVYRVLSRFFGVRTNISSGQGKKEFAALAQSLIPINQPSLFNQAIMNFGANQCTPKKPKCDSCPLQKKCVAFSEQLVDDLPVKSKAKKKKERFFNFFFIQSKSKTYIQKRLGDDIWKHLFQLPLVESKAKIPKEELLKHHDLKILPVHTCDELDSTTHILSHQKIYASFYGIRLKKHLTKEQRGDWVVIEQKELLNYPYPQLVQNFLAKMVKKVL